jgi:hypothetical protein
MTKEDLNQKHRDAAVPVVQWHVTTKADSNRADLLTEVRVRIYSQALAADAAADVAHNDEMKKEDLSREKTAEIVLLSTDKAKEVIALTAICPIVTKTAASQAKAAEDKTKKLKAITTTKTSAKSTAAKTNKVTGLHGDKAGDSNAMKKAVSQAADAVMKMKNTTATMKAMKMTILTTKAAAEAAVRGVAAAGHKAAEAILLTVTDVKKLISEV